MSYRAITCFGLILAVSGGALTALANAQTPPRTESGATLVIPSEQLTRGTPYYVITGSDTQATFISDAPFERISGTSSAIVGYMLVPPVEALPESFPLPGAFRLPVASLDTGMPTRNGHLQSERWLNATSFPDITFDLREVRGASLVSHNEEKQLSVYSATLVGDMTIMGTTRELAVPTRITMMKNAPQSVRGGGDLIAINSEYSVDLNEFAPDVIQKNASVMGTRVSGEIKLSQFLLLSPNSPDAQLDRVAQQIGATPELAGRVLLFRRILTTQHNPEAAYTLGEEVMKEAWEHPQALSTLASFAMDDAASRKNIRFALQAAQRAGELTKHTDAMILSTLASVHYESGNLEQAVLWQRKAVENLAGVPERAAAQIRATLRQYEKESGLTG